ncbi:MAG: phosphatidylserine/phosphatidylglycerophosphate/cardiolipin synthase family protein [Methanobacterium sp.]|nr:phosphatidylserine/phosphatidylglycerophosphate/cardiolipin synthase family protein [Methanobacterium sp.]
MSVKKPNIGVRGRVLDEYDHPLEGLVVQVEGAGKMESTLKDSHTLEVIDKIFPVSLKDYHVLGESETNEDGFYEVLYPPSSYQNILDDEPTIQVVFKDLLGVSELKRTEKHTIISETIKDLGNIIIPRNWAEGWYVTLGSSLKSRFTDDNQVEVLVDNQIELEQVVESIKKARSYIYLTQFEFETDFAATFTSGEDGFHPQNILARELQEAAERGVDVKIILNENLAVPDSYSQMEEFFQDSPVEIREFKAHGLHVMHAKTLVTDGEEAYVIGSPFKKDYWDSKQHIIKDPRRKPHGVRPVHDVSIKLRGGAVYHVEEFFCQMWNYIAQEDQGQGKIEPPTRNPVSNPAGKTPVQIVRSVTPETLTEDGELGIFEGYRKAFAKAKQFIYLENQFLTNKSIIKALKNVMGGNPDLEVIVVMNENPDNPGYKKWQNQCLEKMGITTYQDILDNPQVGFFTLWSTAWEQQKFTIQPVYVHTKVAVVDDIWATVGTANLDGSSLTYVNELEGVFDMEFHRNMEMNAILHRNSSEEILKLRSNLWGEHLGKDVPITRMDNSWLKLWQKVAKNNIKSLKHSKPYLNGHILPYSSEESVEDQLKNFNLETRDWNILD